ncbi:hypothetical protein [Fodinibius saliphilus]|uniref:hypothetical protein n=1 Tax=Fodinibius saliphilus TaxID=1920650 RepID=UPI0011086E16|nr:hypothetical protein [Fodinibius saliphilus]
MKKLLWLFILPLLIIGCAKDYYTSYQSASEGKEYGTLIVKFSNPIKNVNITVDGNLIAEDKFTERVEVANMPVGKHKVKVIASSWELKDDVNNVEEMNIQPNSKQTMLVEVPPKSTGYWIYQTAIYTVTFITSYYLYEW